MTSRTPWTVDANGYINDADGKRVCQFWEDRNEEDFANKDGNAARIVQAVNLFGDVLVEERQVYGNTLLYPANDLARALIALSGNTTLTIAAIVLIKQMGFRILTSGAQPREI